MIRFARPKSFTPKGALHMSAMIDIVFLLLVFFVMTFRIVPQEGDFGIDMVDGSGPATSPAIQVPLHLRLIAAADGSLAELRLNEQKLEGRDELRDILFDLEAEGALQNQTLHLACDYDLDYDEVIKTLDIVTGRRDKLGEVVPLSTKVKFSPAR